ncbi:phage minor tail protein L [bacterium]|nr:phage minor tail protein L [bacterium]
MTLEIDVQKGWHDAIVEMYDIDLSPITGDINDIYYFTNQLKPDSSAIIWKGNTYEALPILSMGYERNTTGQIAQPSLTVANILGTFSAAINDYNDLVGSKVTRRRTFAKYLDGEPSADITQEFPIDIFYIERKLEESALVISWQLGSVMDLEGLQLPRRVITQNHCLWKYRSSECGYVGPPIFERNDERITSLGSSAEAVAVFNAYTLSQQRYVEYQNASSVRNKAREAEVIACAPYSLLSNEYDRSGFLDYYVSSNANDGVITAIWAGATVYLGLEYRQGTQRQYDDSSNITYYEIEEWGLDAAACSAATANLATANANLAAALAAYNASIVSLNNAMTALPANDPVFNLDVCGKRLKSCQLRFPHESLPFGAFPGANLVR